MSITCLTGPMFAGKSTCLKAKITEYADIMKDDPLHRAPLLINHSLDSTRTDITPGACGVSSHSSQFFGVSRNIDVVSASRLKDVDVSNRLVIGVDELQFFPDAYDTVTKWCSDGKTVIVAGLNSDACRRPFGEMHLLLAVATEFVHFTAVCPFCVTEAREAGMDLTPALVKSFVAPFTLRRSGGTEVIDVGAGDKYSPACGKHHTMHNVY
jgi:thymidine kinase